MPVSAIEYHDVIADGVDWHASGFPGNSAVSYKMAAARFAAHLAAVATVGGDTGRDVRQVDAANAPGRVVLFTFDDGGESALHPVADLLEGFGWRGHFLVTTGRIGTPGFLTAQGIVELHRRGHVVGSHTDGHPARMSLVSRADQLREWETSRARLEECLGAAVTVASVPGGYFDREVARAAAAAGIRWLFTSEPVSRVEVVDGCAVIGRYTLRRTSSPALARALAGPGPGARSRQWLTWNAKKVAKRVAGDSYLRFRASLFRDDAAPGARHENR